MTVNCIVSFGAIACIGAISLGLLIKLPQFQDRFGSLVALFGWLGMCCRVANLRILSKAQEEFLGLSVMKWKEL